MTTQINDAGTRAEAAMAKANLCVGRVSGWPAGAKETTLK